jgi:hypothetical protein
MPAGGTYEPIGNYTVSGSTTGNTTFSSIPSTYTDLILVFSGTFNLTQINAIQLNGVTSTVWGQTSISGNGTAASSSRETTQDYLYITNTTNLGTGIGTTIIQFQNYSNTTTNKTVLYRSGAAGALTQSGVGCWRQTSAISSIYITAGGGKYWTAGTTLSLYGIKAA